MGGDQLILLLATIHDVMAAEKALKQAGVWCDLIPTPRQLSSDCGMVVVVRATDLDALRTALAACQLRHEGIYQSADDVYELLET